MGRRKETVFEVMSTLLQFKASVGTGPCSENFVEAGTTMASSEPLVPVPLRLILSELFDCNSKLNQTKFPSASFGSGPQELRYRLIRSEIINDQVGCCRSV